MSKLEMARKALLFSLEKMPDKSVPYDFTAVGTVELLFKVGEKDKALEIAKIISVRSDEMVAYLLKQSTAVTLDLQRNLYTLANLQTILYENGEDELAKQVEERYMKYANSLQ
jgi:hypothetical protein